ncbi:SDR family NAD(P)-dependent oxidoreductase [Salipiger sp.]|uniref:SDR family NAD(P)-dependent oxidoreductase n=1 Tax=Salipiger sp. TaxID=2078585 RepID=UPI003A97FC1D
MALAIVTGGATGIGRHLVSALAGAGYEVAFTHFRAPEIAAAVAAEEAARGATVTAHDCDAGDADEVAALHDRIGPAQLLVNNAGIQTWSPLLDLAVEDWDRVIRTNLRGCFLNTQAAARQMVAGGVAGSIVNIGSGCNKLAFPQLADYTASKGGIEQFTKAAALELGPRGIRVNCVAPGAIETERTRDEADGYAERWSRLTPLRRAGQVGDIAGPVLFFASEAADFVTGQTLWVDGGLFSRAPWADYAEG